MTWRLRWPLKIVWLSFLWQLQPKCVYPHFQNPMNPFDPCWTCSPLRSCVTWMSCSREMSCQQLLIPAGPTVSTPACLSSDLLSAPTPASSITPCSTAALTVRRGRMSGLGLTSSERCERWKLQWIPSYGIKRRGVRRVCSLFIIYKSGLLFSTNIYFAVYYHLCCSNQYFYFNTWLIHNVEVPNFTVKSYNQLCRSRLHRAF